jgi:hypothetical protein
MRRKRKRTVRSSCSRGAGAKSRLEKRRIQAEVQNSPPANGEKEGPFCGETRPQPAKAGTFGLRRLRCN